MSEAVNISAIIKELEGAATLLDEEKARLDAIFSGIGEGLIATNEKGKIIKVNPAAETLLGYTEIELLGLWLPKAILAVDDNGKPVQLIGQPVTKALLAGEPVSQRMFYTKKDKTQAPVLVTASPIMINDVPVGAIQAFRDISREIELEHLKDEFVSIASHELRTPMTAVKWFVSMIEEGTYGPVSPNLKQPLDDIASSTDRLIYLVNDMLDVSRIEAGRMNFNLVSLEPKSAITDTIRILEPLAKQKKLSIRFDSAEILKIQTDPDKFKQVLNNLIGNSLKFTDQGGIRVNMTREPKQVKISIIDTGTGITKEQQAHLFGKFEQVSTAQRGRPQGTGLGLYLSREIVRKMGGELWIEASVPGKGSTFSFTVPLANSSKAAEVVLSIKKGGPVGKNITR